jgi:cell wall-associated NlpC family hydrolase
MGFDQGGVGLHASIYLAHKKFMHETRNIARPSQLDKFRTSVKSFDGA